MVSVAGLRSNPLVGYGLVVDLSGSGDGNAQLTRQSIQSIVSCLGLEVEATALDTRRADEGLTCKEIARDMAISGVSVKRHMCANCRKLAARKRAHAVMVNRERALI